MKIAIWHNLPSGGGKRALHDQVRGLVRAGHEVEAWCPDSANQSFLPLGPLLREHVRPLDPDGQLSRPKSGFRWLRAWQGIRRSGDRDRLVESHCQRCAKEILDGGFDVVLVAPCQYLLTPPLGKYLSGLPKVLYLQEPYRSRYEAQPRLPWLQPPDDGLPPLSPQFWRKRGLDLMNTRLLRWRAREELDAARAYDRILVNSLYSRESVLRAYGLESSVCYLGIDAELFFPPSPSQAMPSKFVVSVGSLHRNKGIDRAIRALAAVPATKRPSLVWIGNGSDPSYVGEMEILAAECGVEFIRKEMIRDEEMIAIMQQAAMMLYTPRLEPFGYAPLEANACGVPVVAIAEGGVRETIIDEINGLLVPGDDPERLAAAIGRLLDHPELAARLGQQGRQQVEKNWTLSAAERRLETFLQASVTAGPRASGAP